MSRRPLNTMERLRAESMNPAQTNRQLVVDAHEEIRILKEEVIRAHARSLEARIKHEGGWRRMKDASIEALGILTECKDHYDTQTHKGDPHELWSRVTKACSVMYECLKLEGIELGNQEGDAEAEESANPETAESQD